jgi:NitT/TauT family transport system substrate-binding protein
VARKLTEVNFFTAGNDARYAYIWVGLGKGFFQDAGFDLNFLIASSQDALKLLAAGKADYIETDPTTITLARVASDVPAKIVYVYHQVSSACVVVEDDSPIRAPKDFEGKTIATTPAGSHQVLFPLYAKKAGIDASKVKFVTAQQPALPALLASGQADGCGSFATALPIFERAVGKPCRSLRYAQYLPGLVGPSFGTSDDRIASKSDEVRRFAAAINRTVHYALDNPIETGKIAAKLNPLIDPWVAAQCMKIAKPLADTPYSRKYGWGHLDPQRQKNVISIVRNGYHLSETVPASDVFDLQFVPPPKAS